MACRRIIKRSLYKKGGTPSKVILTIVIYFSLFYILIFLASAAFVDTISENCVNNAKFNPPNTIVNVITFIALLLIPLAALIYILTFGMGIACGIPASIVIVIGLFNGILILVTSYMIMFYLRGSE